MHPRKTIPVGSVFGMLTVLGPAEPNEDGKSQVNLLCECGTRVIRCASKLRGAYGAKSCGCLRTRR